MIALQLFSELYTLFSLATFNEIKFEQPANIPLPKRSVFLGISISVRLEQWKNAQEQIQVNNGVISYTDEFGTEQSWQALVEYTQAKATKGLTISKYKQIIGMGGSLYALIHEYESAGVNATDSYIFALKQEQYNWSAEQSDFIKNYYTKPKHTAHI